MQLSSTLDSLLEYLLDLAAADPPDARVYMEENPPQLATRGRSAPSNPVRLAVVPPAVAPPGPPQAAAADSLGDMLSSLTLEKKDSGAAGKESAAAPSPIAAAKMEGSGGCGSNSSGDTSAAYFTESTALSGAAAATGDNREKQRAAEDAVPRGTSLHLLCIKASAWLSPRSATSSSSPLRAVRSY